MPAGPLPTRKHALLNVLATSIAEFLRLTRGPGLPLALLPLLLLPGPVQGQWLDNPAAPRFGVRVGALPSVTSWGQTFGADGGSLPMGSELTDPGLGTRLLPHLGPVEALVASLSGSPGFGIRMGGLRVIRSTTVVTVPVSLELGVTSFLTVGASLPFVRRRTESDVRFTPGGANSGFNPALQDASAVEGFLTAFLSSLEEGRTLLGGVCGADPAGAACRGASAALNDGDALLQGLRLLYGNSPVVPLVDSEAGIGLHERFTTFARILGQLGGTPPTGLPPLAAAPLDAEGFALFTQSGRYGVGLDTLGTVQRAWELGDAEVHASARLLERVDRDAAGNFLGRTFLAAGAGVRLPTGQPPAAASLFDPGTGGGSVDLTLRLHGDVARPWWGMRVEGRYTRRGPAELERRVAPPEAALAGLLLQRSLERSGGHLLGVEVAPRLALTPDFGVGVSYAFSRRSGELYRLVESGSGVDENPLAPPTPDPAVLATGTEGSLHHMGFHATYTSVNARREGRATGRPFEVFVRYGYPVASGGGILAPRAHTFQGGVILHLGGF